MRKSRTTLQRGVDLNGLTTSGEYAVVDPVNGPGEGVYSVSVYHATEDIALYVLQVALNLKDGTQKVRSFDNEWSAWQDGAHLKAFNVHVEDKFHGKTPNDFAPYEHTHAQYAKRKELDQYIHRDDMPELLVAVLKRAQGNLDVGKLGGKTPGAYMLAENFTADKLLALLEGQEGLEATYLGGRHADAYAIEGHHHDGAYEPRNTKLLKADAPQVLSAGVRQRTYNVGVIKAGEVFTPDPNRGRLQRYTNGGAHTLKAPTATDDYEIRLLVTNGQSAGLITLKGFSNDLPEIVVYPHTKLLLTITKINEVADLEIKNLR